MTCQTIAQAASSELSAKLGGLSHLFQMYDQKYSRSRDSNDVQGIGSLLEQLSNEASAITELLDESEGLDPKFEVPVKDRERDPVGFALRFIRSQKRAAK